MPAAKQLAFLAAPIKPLAGAGARSAVPLSASPDKSTPVCRMDHRRGCKVLKTTTAASTRWLKLLTVDYSDPEGKTRHWDMVERATRTSSSSVDAIAILARLSRSSAPNFDTETILVKQFRPPMNCITVELPAGLVDPGETPEQAALRELKEETGFTGTNPKVARGTCTSPGLCNEIISLVTVDVDLDAVENQCPEPQLEESEFIEAERVQLSRLLERLDELASDGLIVFTGLHSLAVGLSMSL